MEWLRQHGRHSLAYSTCQPAMGYWESEGGFAAYRTTLGQHSFLGDPVCRPEEKADFLRQLVNVFPSALFMQIHRDTADLLKAGGYYITPVGVENEIDTASFSLFGKRKADLRHYRNKAVESGVVVAEVADTPALRASLQPVSAAWLPKKSWLQRELEFLARPFVETTEPDVRIFTGSVDGIVIAFVILDPMYDQGAISGYTVTILRHYPDAPEGSVDFIVLHVIEVFAREGVPLLSLGVSPFHHLEELARIYGRGSLPVYWLYLALREWGNSIYHFRGLSFHKSRYRAREVPVFTAIPGPVGLWSVYASARACRML